MGLKDVMAARRASGQTVDVPVAGIEGLTSVRVRRLSAAEALATQREKDPGLALVVAAIRDEDGAPAYASAAEAAAEDWVLMQALLLAATKVNLLDVAAAKKD